jgi:hypothetical protein
MENGKRMVGKTGACPQGSGSSHLIVLDRQLTPGLLKFKWPMPTHFIDFHIPSG